MMLPSEGDEILLHSILSMVAFVCVVCVFAYIIYMESKQTIRLK